MIESAGKTEEPSEPARPYSAALERARSKKAEEHSNRSLEGSGSRPRLAPRQECGRRRPGSAKPPAAATPTSDPPGALAGDAIDAPSCEEEQKPCASDAPIAHHPRLTPHCSQVAVGSLPPLPPLRSAAGTLPGAGPVPVPVPPREGVLRSAILGSEDNDGGATTSDDDMKSGGDGNGALHNASMPSAAQTSGTAAATRGAAAARRAAAAVAAAAHGSAAPHGHRDAGDPNDAMPSVGSMALGGSMAPGDAVGRKAGGVHSPASDDEDDGDDEEGGAAAVSPQKRASASDEPIAREPPPPQARANVVGGGGYPSDEDEESADGAKDTATLQREHRSRGKKSKRERRKEKERSRQSVRNGRLAERERPEKPGACLTCCGLLFANCFRQWGG